jgi:GDP/UDP-N,N'-diacetylbacillosamine 2-epimerase (hydrolysing)
MKKVCFVTGSRSDYDILYPLILRAKDDLDLQINLVVTGSHLVNEFGMTYNKIVKDGLVVNRKFDILLASNTSAGVSKSMGLLLISIGEYFEDFKPDLVIAVGDRYEMFTVATAALVSSIPIAHIHGGELTEASIDDSFRHSITKMSNLHLVATSKSRNRVLQLGEDSNNVHVVGAMGIENIDNTQFMTKSELENSLEIKFRDKNLLITYHPETGIGRENESEFHILLDSLSELNDTSLIFTMPNSDSYSAAIMRMIEEFSSTHSNAYIFKSLGRERYFSCIKYCDGVIGNSSSGIIEVPSLKKGSINIGSRQKGRDRADSVIDCALNKIEILSAIETLYSENYLQKIMTVNNPYYNKFASKNSLLIIKKFLSNNIHRKKFIDISFGGYNND